MAEFKSFANNSSKIKLTFYAGTLTGNIIPTAISFFSGSCAIQLDFSCVDNSQYIPLF